VASRLQSVGPVGPWEEQQPEPCVSFTICARLASTSAPTCLWRGALPAQGKGEARGNDSGMGGSSVAQLQPLAMRWRAPCPGSARTRLAQLLQQQPVAAAGAALAACRACCAPRLPRALLTLLPCRQSRHAPERRQWHGQPAPQQVRRIVALPVLQNVLLRGAQQRDSGTRAGT
jgi:hypothetical protein